jgi:hypothetical protein
MAHTHGFRNTDAMMPMAAIDTDALILPTLCLNTDSMMLMAAMNTDVLPMP